MYDLIKLLYEQGIDITQYLVLGEITAEEYAEIVGGDNEKA